MLQTSEQLEHLKLAAEVAGLEVGRFTLPEDHDVVVNRMRFHYLDWGAPAAIRFFFCTRRAQRAYVGSRMPGAPREYHCIALDQRGHGDSEWSPVGDYSLPSQVRDIEHFIEKLGSNARWWSAIRWAGLRRWRTRRSSRAGWPGWCWSISRRS